MRTNPKQRINDKWHISTDNLQLTSDIDNWHKTTDTRKVMHDNWKMITDTWGVTHNNLHIATGIQLKYYSFLLRINILQITHYKWQITFDD